MIESIQRGGKWNKTEEGDGKVVVAHSDAAMASCATEGVLNSVAIVVKHAVVVIGRVPAYLWGNTGEHSAGSKVVAKAVDIEAAVGQNPAYAEMLLRRDLGVHVVLRAARQTGSSRLGDSVHDGGHLRIEPALDYAHGLVDRTFRGIGLISMYFDGRTIHATNPTQHPPAQLRMELGRRTRCAPLRKARVNRTPRTELRRQGSSRQFGPPDIPDGRGDKSAVLLLSATTVPGCQIARARPPTLDLFAGPAGAPAVCNVSSSRTDTLRFVLSVMDLKSKDMLQYPAVIRIPAA